MTETFAARLRRLRLARGLSQAGLASAAGASSPIAACRWETGHSHPRVMALPLVAAALGVTVDYLITGQKPRHDPVQESPRLTAPMRAAVVRMIQDGATNAQIRDALGVTLGQVGGLRWREITQRKATEFRRAA